MGFTEYSYLTEKEYENILELEKSSELELFERILRVYKTYGPLENEKILREAFSFGQHIHRLQKRESGVPYFTHPLIVTLMMMKYSPSSDLIIATMLHDTIEDSEEEGTEAEVRSRFGEGVYTMIDGVSKVESVEQSKEQKNKETLKKLFSCAEKESRILVIKIFDRLHNIMTLSGKKDIKKRKKKAEETMNVYLPASETLGLWEVKKRLENACIAHLFPQKTKEIESLRNQALEMHQNTLEKFEEHLVNTPYRAESRWYSTMDLIHRYGSSEIPLEHLFFIRIIVPTEDECYKASSEVNKYFPPKKNSLKNYITSPKINGYRSVHTVNIVNDAYSVHVHLVSESMRERNDIGVFTNINRGEYELPVMTGIYIESMFLDAFEYVSILTGDILTKKITIYNPEKGRLSFPKKSLVLDVAIALFPEKWHYLRSGKVNGAPVSIFHPLSEDDIISFDFADTPQIKQNWVSLVKTVQAKFLIQKVLKTHDPQAQIQEGKKMIQSLWDQEKRGNIYDTLSKNSSLLTQLQVESIEDLFKNIYQGKIMPEEIVFLVRDIEEKSTSWWGKIRSFFPGKPKDERYKLSLSIESSLLTGGESEQIIKKQCMQENIQLRKFSLTTTEKGSQGKIFLDSEEYRPLLNVFHSLQTDPRINVFILPPSLFLWKMIFFFVIPMCVSIGIFVALFGMSENDHTLFLYLSAFFMALANALGYSTISQYFSWLRHSIPFLLVFIFINALISGAYVYCFFQKGYDTYSLDFYFPLIVLLLSMAFPIFFFKKDKVKEPDLPSISTEEYKKKQKEKRLGYLIRFGAVVIWGLDPILLKYTPASTVPIDLKIPLIFLGGLISSVLIIMFLKKSLIKENYKIPLNKHFFILTFGMILLTIVMIKSLQYGSGTNFILLNNFAPIFALLVAMIFFRHKIPYLQDKKNIILIFFAFFIGSIGSSFLFYNDFSNGDSGNFSGNLFALIYVFLDVLFITSQIEYAKNLKGVQSYFVNFYTYTLCFISFIPLLLFSFPSLLSLSIEQFLYTLLIGSFWGVGLILNIEAFRRMDGFIAFLMFNISIFITFAVESFILKEIPATLLLVLGGSLIIGASIFAEIINTRCERKQIQEKKSS